MKSVDCAIAHRDAEIAQLVEHFTRNEGVVGSSPIFSFYSLEIKKHSVLGMLF